MGTTKEESKETVAPVVLILSDIHITNHKSDMKRLQDCLEVLRWALATARQRKIRHVLFLGDLFHDRQKISVYAYQKTYEIIKEYYDIIIHILLGNHDLWYHDLWDVSSVFPLGALANVDIIDKPTTKTIEGLSIDFLPFTHNPIKMLAEFSGKSRLLCAHIALDGAQLNKLYNTRAEVSVEHDNDMVKVGVELFSGWEKVLLGHYHGEQRIGVIEYVGSPLQLSFSEAFQKKHIIILNTKTLEQEYIENTFSPRHLIINKEDIKSHDLNNNFVEINVDSTNSADIMDLKKSLSETVRHVEFRERRSREVIAKEENIEKFNLVDGDIIERYVSSNEITSLDKSKLLKIGREICSQ